MRKFSFVFVAMCVACGQGFNGMQGPSSEYDALSVEESSGDTSTIDTPSVDFIVCDSDDVCATDDVCVKGVCTYEGKCQYFPIVGCGESPDVVESDNNVLEVTEDTTIQVDTATPVDQLCVGKICDDNNPCTTDTCYQGECYSTAESFGDWGLCARMSGAWYDEQGDLQCGAVYTKCAEENSGNCVVDVCDGSACHKQDVYCYVDRECWFPLDCPSGKCQLDGKCVAE